MRLQKQPDAWSEGVPLPLVFDCYAMHEGVLSSMVLELGTGMAVKPGGFAIHRDQNLSPNQQLLEGAAPDTT